MLTRICPQCNTKITYKSTNGFNYAVNNDSICRKCAGTDSGFLIGKSGVDNPFYGHRHTKKSRKKMSDSRIKRGNIYKTKKFRKKISKTSKGKNNPMYGRSVYSVWLQKFGKIVADKKLKSFKKKISKSTSGKKNKNYGKTPDNRCGSGWKGWYKGWFFRSLRELSYVVSVLEKEKRDWVSAECNNLRIEYISAEKTKKTYVADFLVDNKYLIEIKPKKLQKTPNNIAKAKAAKRFCKKLGLIYQMVDCKVLSSEQIKNLYDQKSIKFTDLYEKKYKEKYLK